MTESTWEDTYERSFARVFRGLIALGARPDEAEDALHDAFLRGLEAGEIASPAGWLFVVASRRWRRRRWRDRIFRPLFGTGGTSDSAPEIRIDLFDALRKLTRCRREVLVARYLVGLSPDETAHTLGIAPGTVVEDDLQIWTVRAFEDAAAQVTLPPRDRWIPQERKSSGTKAAAMLLLAALVLVGIALVFAEPSRKGAGEPPKTPSPTFSRNDSGTPLPTEAEAWGGIWSEANGVAVLRPTWLPKSKDEYQVFPRAATSRDGFFGYEVSYYELHSVPGTTVWFDFVADSLETQARGLIQFGGVPQTVTIRGHAAELTGSGSPGWVLVWSEGNYRYAIRAFVLSRDDLLRIADSLAPVADDTGRTAR